MGEPTRAWPADTLARVPFWVYQDEANYQTELRRIFEGPTWSYVCLESDVAAPGEFRTTFVGEMPVIVVRGQDGAVHAFENRCGHRGALIALDDAGSVKNAFQCVYHAWSYDLRGNLIGIAFEKGSNGRGGMPSDFCKADHGPRKLRTTTLCGLVFATLSPETPPIEDYLGAEILGRVRRVMDKPVQVLGRFTQGLPNNWKLYFENVKDTYHASLLHAFSARSGSRGSRRGAGCWSVLTARTTPPTRSACPRTPRAPRIASRGSARSSTASASPTRGCSTAWTSSTIASSCRS